MAAGTPDDAPPTGAERSASADSGDQEIETLLEREAKRISKQNAYLTAAGFLGIVMGVATLVWYQRVPSHEMEDVAKGVIINMIAAAGLLGLVLGVGFIGLAVYIRRHVLDGEKQ